MAERNPRAEVLGGEPQAGPVGITCRHHFADLIERLTEEEERVGVRRIRLKNFTEGLQRVVEALLVHQIDRILNRFPVRSISIHACAASTAPGQCAIREVLGVLQ